jgi:hypothetical protein
VIVAKHAPKRVLAPPATASDEWSMLVETSPMSGGELIGVRILVVEDDADCRDMLRTLLEMSGATVATATGAREGLRAFEATRPHVLVSDLSMPDEDGCWLIRNVLGAAESAGRGPAAVVLTAHTDDRQRTRCLAAGFDVFLTKPIDPIQLRDVIARLARSAAAF